MTEQPTIAVRGTAQQDAPPEQAMFTVTVAARDRNRETALTRVAERAAEVRRLIDAHGVERRETDRVHVYPELKDGREKVTAYVASVSTRLTVTEFGGLGEFLLRLGRADQVQVSGPWWSLRPESRAGAEVRAAAVADALQRARDYASAVGARVDRLVEIVEDGATTALMMPPPFARAQAVFLSAGSAAAPELELDPSMQTVSADVTVRVTITEPALPGD